MDLDNEVIKKEFDVVFSEDGQDTTMLKKILQDLGLNSFREMIGDGMFSLSCCK